MYRNYYFCAIYVQCFIVPSAKNKICVIAISVKIFQHNIYNIGILKNYFYEVETIC